MKQEYQSILTEVELLKENNKELKEINQILKKKLKIQSQNKSHEQGVSVSIFSDEDDNHEEEVDYSK